VCEFISPKDRTIVTCGYGRLELFEEASMSRISYTKRLHGMSQEKSKGIIKKRVISMPTNSYLQCDGQHPCARCQFQNVDCQYEIPTRQSKEQMRTEIEQLRKQLKQAERILAALVSNDRSEDILEQLRSGKTLEDISERLDIGKGTASTPAILADRRL
jgi:hypothetical protein